MPSSPAINGAKDLQVLAPENLPAVTAGIGGIIYWKGRNFIPSLFPPIVTGAIMMVIGLMLVPVAVSMALGKSNPAHLIPDKIGLLIAALIALGALAASSILLVACGGGGGGTDSTTSHP